MSKLIKRFPKQQTAHSIQIGIQHITGNVRLSGDRNDHSNTSMNLTNAKKEAESIIFQAEKQAEYLLLQAKQHADDKHLELIEKEKEIEHRTIQAIEEGRKQGFSQGYDEGVLQSRSEYSEAITEARTILSKAKSEYHERLNEAESSLIKLSLEVSKKIIGDSLQMDEMYQRYVTEALKQIKGEEDVKLFVSPDQYNNVQKTVKKLESVYNIDIIIYPDETMSKQQCLIETKYGQIDASIDSQLTQIREKLLDVIEVGEEGGHNTDIEYPR
ncbi:flagellar assembly protein FliH [Pseudalkalibacillus decolorationis]|uniref:flagellar assembly protein FliH n=1 Tax=Pseudalkalibacillus decolorationis TaxID=163879 RepID=UPI002148FA28|nr:flagellar assembly protein FliH [Pseudalkalibacillus decolorationis]